jgi:hypothetical protein
MRPIPIVGPYAEAKEKLDRLTFTVLVDGDKEVVRYPEIIVDGGAFMSSWKPGWRERIRLLIGAPVRVLVNYSAYGPLYLDTESDWGVSSPRDW